MYSTAFCRRVARCWQRVGLTLVAAWGYNPGCGQRTAVLCLFLSGINAYAVGGRGDEADLSAEEAPAAAPARVFGEDADPWRPEGSEASARQGSGAPGSLSIARAFRGGAGRRGGNGMVAGEGGVSEGFPRGQVACESAGGRVLSTRAGSEPGRCRGGAPRGQGRDAQSPAAQAPGDRSSERRARCARVAGGHRCAAPGGLRWVSGNGAGSPLALETGRVGGVWVTMGRRLVLRCIRFYQQVLSPLKPPSCRFVPSCSQYAFDAVARFGIAKGLYLAFRRVVRCGPWHPGGYDPVPEKIARGD